MKRGTLLKIFGYTAFSVPLVLTAATTVCFLIWPENWAFLILSGICLAVSALPCGLIAVILGFIAYLRSDKKVLCVILMVLGALEEIVGIMLLSIAI